jgi:hypothetical protein
MFNNIACSFLWPLYPECMEFVSFCLQTFVAFSFAFKLCPQSQHHFDQLVTNKAKEASALVSFCLPLFRALVYFVLAE